MAVGVSSDCVSMGAGVYGQYFYTHHTYVVTFPERLILNNHVSKAYYESQSQYILVINAQMALNYVKNCSQSLRFIRTEDGPPTSI